MPCSSFVKLGPFRNVGEHGYFTALNSTVTFVSITTASDTTAAGKEAPSEGGVVSRENIFFIKLNHVFNIYLR